MFIILTASLVVEIEVFEGKQMLLTCFLDSRLGYKNMSGTTGNTMNQCMYVTVKQRELQLQGHYTVTNMASASQSRWDCRHNLKTEHSVTT
jgi:hypothetical protein